IYDNLIPDSALTLTISDASFGSYGWSNTISEPIILCDAEGDTVQVYYYSLGNMPGFSDEKIHLVADNTPENWGNSLMFRGTPGQKNSLSLLNIDLQLDSIWINPNFPPSNVAFQIFASFVNAGLEIIEHINFTIFFDYNQNLLPDSLEVVYQETLVTHIVTSGYEELDWEMTGLETGSYWLGILAETVGDENMNNNLKVISLEIESAENPVIINEIMFNPVSGEAEWIELYNKGQNDINLGQWLIADVRDTVMISTDPYILNSHDYTVLGDDSSIINYYAMRRFNFIYIPSFPTLNNDTDDLKLFSSSKRLQDRVMYHNSWMRREVLPGTSLERIHPDISSMLAENWAASADPTGATPGKLNSIFIEKPTEKSVLEIQPNPFSPDGDGFEDFVIFEYRLPFPTGYLTIQIYDIKGRKIKSIAEYTAVGQHGNFIWDGRNDSGRFSRMGIYVILVRIFEPYTDKYSEFKKSLVLVKNR
ncbi:MAG: lamin tail domain-containing protein, partial [bacterium]